METEKQNYFVCTWTNQNDSGKFKDYKKNHKSLDN